MHKIRVTYVVLLFVYDCVHVVPYNSGKVFLLVHIIHVVTRGNSLLPIRGLHCYIHGVVTCLVVQDCVTHIVHMEVQPVVTVSGCN